MSLRGKNRLSLQPSLEALEDRCVPATITTLSVENTQVFARTDEPVTTGVPLPQTLNRTSTAGLRILDASGQEVPAEFRVLGRWGGGPQETTRPIRWLEVTFAADVAAQSTATYTLDDAATGTTPAGIQYSQTTNLIEVTTGPARFQIDRFNFNLFNTVWLDANNNGVFADDERIVQSDSSNGSFVLQNGNEYRSSLATATSVTVERAGPLRLVVRAEGFHRTGAGAELLRYVTRLTFHAGQSFVEVDHTIIEGRQQGTGNGDLDNQVRTDITRAGLRVNLELSGTVNTRLRGGTGYNAAGNAECGEYGPGLPGFADQLEQSDVLPGTDQRNASRDRATGHPGVVGPV